MTSPRLHTDQPLAVDMAVLLNDRQAHYLGQVMRLRAGESLTLFNGRDGGWLCALETIGKRQAIARCKALIQPQEQVPDVWLLAAPLRKGRFEWVAEKACELGVAALKPVLTRRTVPERLRLDRLQAIAIEAAEQCGRTSVTAIEAALPLEAVLANWPAGRALLFCDETATCLPALTSFSAVPPGPAAILIGPEGGFDPAERVRIGQVTNARTVGLGPRILRADTAAVTAIGLWQATRGDWTG